MSEAFITADIAAMTAEEYLKDRLEDQIAWYDRRSAASKKGFIVLQIFTLVASASIPVFSIFSGDMWVRVIVAILGSATAVSTGTVALYQFREHWVEYRTTSELLKHEKYMFHTRTGPYAGEDAFSVLVEWVEMLVSQENTAWQQRLTNQRKEYRKRD